MMRLPAVVAFALAVATLPGVAQPPAAKAPPPPENPLKAVADDLKEARGLLKKVADKATRDRLELLITRSELAVNEAVKAAAPAKPAAMAADDFAKVLKGLKSESFDDGKVKFVKGLGAKVRFTSAQAKELLAAFAFDSGKVSAAVTLYPLVTDPEFFFQAMEAITFESSKRDLREKLGMK